MVGIAIVGGVAIGFALGLTGGGGGVFAVPLLVYGMGIPAREAVGVSLAAVGLTALVGATARYFRGEIDARTGLIFAVAGMIGAPLGSQLSKLLPEAALLLLFSGLMLIVAARMWRASRSQGSAADAAGFVCQRDAAGHPKLGGRCVALLLALGTTTGVLSGLFGVGGGFVIVPALVLFGGLAIHTAVATSLLVIFLVSASGVTAYVANGGALSWVLTGFFALGGLVGMQLGVRLSSKLSGPTLQRTFSAAMVLVAAFIVVKSFA